MKKNIIGQEIKEHNDTKVNFSAAVAWAEIEIELARMKSESLPGKVITLVFLYPITLSLPHNSLFLTRHNFLFLSRHDSLLLF